MSEELSSTGTGRLRDGRIVNLRALAILLVVFGHSIILYENTWNIYTTKNSVPLLNTMKIWINLIQMPLFFSLSGYLFYFGYPRTNLKKLLKKKAVRLLIPYAAAALLWMIPIRLLIGYPGYQGKSIF